MSIRLKYCARQHIGKYKTTLCSFMAWAIAQTKYIMTIVHVPYRNPYHYWATVRSAIRVFCATQCGNLNTGRHVQRSRGVKLNVTAKQTQKTVVWSSCYERQTPLDGRVRAAVCAQNRAFRCGAPPTSHARWTQQNNTRIDANTNKKYIRTA